MGALQIECYSSKEQIDGILLMVESRLYKSLEGEPQDLDEEMYDMRICVDYDFFMNKVSLKLAEILDREWDVLYEDTAVFNSRLRRIVNKYNSFRNNGLSQSREIRCDQLGNMKKYGSILD